MQTVVAKDTMSAAVKLAGEIQESASGVIDDGVVSHRMTYSRDELRRAMTMTTTHSDKVFARG